MLKILLERPLRRQQRPFLPSTLSLRVREVYLHLHSDRP